MTTSAWFLIHIKKTEWLFAAVAAFLLTAADCLYRNRDAAVMEDPKFPQYLICGAVTFVSFALVFLLGRFWISAPLIACGGVCVFLLAPELRVSYLYAALPAILAVFLIRYWPLAETRKPVVLFMYGLLSALELTAVLYLLDGLLRDGSISLNEILPFSKLRGRLTNNYYGLVFLFFLFVFYVRLHVRREKGSRARKKAARKRPGNKKMTNDSKSAVSGGQDVCVWLRFTAVCLFFALALLYCLRQYSETFLPVSSFINLVAVFVIASQLSADGTLFGKQMKERPEDVR